VADLPETRFARSVEGAYIAYEVIGDGPSDLVVPFNGGVPIDLIWDEPAVADWVRRLASFSRLIALDLRGFGSSSSVNPKAVPVVQTWMDDLAAVMDAVGSRRAGFLGWGEGALTTMLFAATYPRRTTSLVLINSFARYARSDKCPWGIPAHLIGPYAAAIEAAWGHGGITETLAPSLLGTDDARKRWARLERIASTPDVGAALTRAFMESDITAILPAIQAPTLVICRQGDRHVRSQHSRFLAENINGARLVELSGEDHLPFAGRSDEILDEVEEFITGVRPTPVLDRMLATVLFTDIVGSTQQAAELGDRRWRDLLDAHDRVVRRQLERFRGKEVDNAGDGFFATFDGPGRAIECACAIRDAVQAVGVQIRAGLHTGEIELRGDDVAGIAVHIGARVSALAGAGEVLVSGSMPPLVAGSGIQFTDRGEHELKGVPDTWRVFAVA
jgi:class 3 adenylate cyclase